MIGPLLMGAVAIVFGLRILAISGTLARWAANRHWTLHDAHMDSYSAKKRQTIRIGAMCFMSIGGALLLMGLLSGLITGRWVWSSLAVGPNSNVGQGVPQYGKELR